MKPPRPLGLDHFAPPRGAPAAGIALLALGIAAAAFMAARHDQLTGEMRRFDLERARAKSVRPVRQTAIAQDPRKRDEAVRRANAVARQIALPWSEVFEAVEAASGHDIALLTIEPDPRRGLLRLSAEARDKTAMLAYLRALQGRSAIGRVALDTHAVQEERPRQPVQFSLVASWVGLQ